jgi:multiple sugar transport system permease protein
VKHRVALIKSYLLAGVAVVFTIFPVGWLFLTSIKPTREIYAWPPVYFPSTPTMANYERLIAGEGGFLRYIRNSLIVSGTSTLCILALATFAAYSLARMKYRGRTAILLGMLALSMFPAIAIIPPLFLVFRHLSLINTYRGMIIGHTALFMPMGVWILTNYFKTLPADLEEAAWVDGCGPLRMLWSIMLPLSLPGLVAAGLIVFVSSWNEFLMSLVFLSKNDMRTAVVGISLYPGEYAFPWELISTATFLSILPILLITLLFQRYIISGLTAGASKL